MPEEVEKEEIIQPPNYIQTIHEVVERQVMITPPPYVKKTKEIVQKPVILQPPDQRQIVREKIQHPMIIQPPPVTQIIQRQITETKRKVGEIVNLPPKITYLEPRVVSSESFTAPDVPIRPFSEEVKQANFISTPISYNNSPAFTQPSPASQNQQFGQIFPFPNSSNIVPQMMPNNAQNNQLNIMQPYVPIQNQQFGSNFQFPNSSNVMPQPIISEVQNNPLLIPQAQSNVILTPQIVASQPQPQIIQQPTVQFQQIARTVMVPVKKVPRTVMVTVRRSGSPLV